MTTEKRIIDLNAYIVDLRCDKKTLEDKLQLTFSFKNLNHGTITAIRLLCVAYDSFGDKLQFEGKEFYEVKRANLKIEPGKKASFSIEIEKCDIKEMEVSAAQIVYLDGEMIIPKEPKFIEYEIEVLSSSWSSGDNFEKDALSIMREKNDRAVCFPKIYSNDWICVCGRLNSESESNCVECGSDKKEIFGKLNEEIIRAEIDENTKRKQEEAERRREKEKIEQERAKKKKKVVSISVVTIIVFAIIIGILYGVTYNLKYGLSDEEKVQYDTAQSNYYKIEKFIRKLGNDYFDKAFEYYDDSRHENRMSDAEKDKDYLYARGIYLASSLLYDSLNDKYPDNYQKVYEQLANLQKGDIYITILIEETLYIKSSPATDMLEKQDGIDEAIDKMEKYMNRDTLNPSKVEIDGSIGIGSPDYSKVYGINLGILYYEGGRIQYIGEFKDGKANGYGRGWYPSEDKNGEYCEGTCEGEFKDGVFKNGIAFNGKGDEIDVNELSAISFAGEFEVVKGLSNTTSSEDIAQQNANSEEEDITRAQIAVKDYLDMAEKKQTSITNIVWTDIPDISGDYYYFSCTVEFGDLKRKGIVTVEKKSNGTFEAIGLKFND